MEERTYLQGYAKGQQLGARKAEETRKKCQEQVDEAIARAERAERAAGLGPCHKCANWTRYENRARWGHCLPPPSQHANGNPLWFGNDSGKGSVVTTDNFGCVMFKHRLSE